MAQNSQSSLISTPTSQLSIAASTVVNDPPEELTWHSERWLRSIRPPIKRRGVAQSRIWQYGSYYIMLSKPTISAWRCDRCPYHHLISFKHDGTSNARRHLEYHHNIICPKETTVEVSREVQEEVELEEIEENEDSSTPGPIIRGLVQIVNVDDFRFHLVRWIVEKHLPFAVVEDVNGVEGGDRGRDAYSGMLSK